MNLVVTEGMHHLCERAGAHWLMDLVASYQTPLLSDETFQLWSVEVENGRGRVTCQRDTGEKFLVEQELTATDWPADELGNKYEFYVQHGTVGMTDGQPVMGIVAMLKSEY